MSKIIYIDIFFFINIYIVKKSNKKKIYSIGNIFDIFDKGIIVSI